MVAVQAEDAIAGKHQRRAAAFSTDALVDRSGALFKGAPDHGVNLGSIAVSIAAISPS
jgi:hypothetical protein